MLCWYICNLSRGGYASSKKKQVKTSRFTFFLCFIVCFCLDTLSHKKISIKLIRLSYESQTRNTTSTNENTHLFLNNICRYVKHVWICPSIKIEWKRPFKWYFYSSLIYRNIQKYMSFFQLFSLYNSIRLEVCLFSKVFYESLFKWRGEESTSCSWRLPRGLFHS